MANPFLVLGGIAVGIVAATFGILQVPGWIGTAQDVAAVNDLAQVYVARPPRHLSSATVSTQSRR
ncbi:hypothetical protein [Microbacterium enclense]|uniref:hypothetical protein n=1 Tax=Microbacterium enclense TaxID=993073 RepID=UPI003D715727